MTYESGSAISRRRLGRELRELRERAHLSQDEAATALDCSRQKIWRIESGAVPVRPRDVKVLCNLYSAGPRVTQRLAGLALRTRERGWWQAYGDVLPTWLSRYVGLESAASRLRCYQSDLIPALLQTRSYVEALYADRPGLNDTERDRLIGVHLRRQEVLARRTPPPRLEIFLPEAALYRRVLAGSDMLAQLCHLRQSSIRQNISVRVVPLAAGPILASAAGSFVMLDFPGADDMATPESADGTMPDSTTVYLESLTGAIYLDRPDEVRLYEHAWTELARHALDEMASDELVHALTERS